MGRLVDLGTARAERDPNIRKLIQFSVELDHLIIRYLNDPTTNSSEILSIVAHRLGTFIDSTEQKSELWSFCEKVAKRQAHLS